MRTVRQLLGVDPTQEAAHRTLMRLYLRQGRRGAALRQYQACVGVLQREVGTLPEPETRMLYRELLQAPVATAAARHGSITDPAASMDRVDLPQPVGPLLGREAEMQQLGQARKEAWQGRGRVALVLGEAGIGKSRLVAELVADASEHGGRVVAGRAHETQHVIPFGPWVEAFRASEVLGEALEGLDPRWRSELGRLFPELGAPESPNRPSDQNYVRLFEAVLQILTALAARQPLVLILEDLHWADEMSLRLLTFVSRRVAAWPALVVATVREEELPGASALRQFLEEVDHERRLETLTLGPLSEPETAALVRALAREGTESSVLARLVEWVWTASAGNPFIVVETMQALRETGGDSALATLALPPRIRDTIAGRLDRLSERGRQMAALAATIGSEFEFALLQAAAGLDPHEVAEAVEELVARRVLHAVAERLDFTHDRIQQVVYERLLPPLRRALHLMIGRALEISHADRLSEVYDRLAFHFARTDETEKAVHYLGHFADQAARAYAHGDAVRVLDEALARVESLPSAHRDRTRLELILRKTACLHVLGRFPESMAILLAERDGVERLHDLRLAGRFQFRLGHTHSILGNRAEAAAWARRAVESATRCGDDPTLGQAHYVLAVESVFAGQLTEGAEHGRQAIGVLDRHPERQWLGLAYWITGYIHFWLGDLEAAMAAAAQALAVGDAMDDARIRGFAGWTLGLVHAMRGEWDASLRACQAARDVARDPVSAAFATAWLGCVQLWRDDLSLAMPLFEEAIRRFQAFGYRQAQGFYLAALAEACVETGDVERARGLASESLALTRETGFVIGVAWALQSLGRTARATGDLAEAEARFVEAVATARSIGARLEVARAHLALADLAQVRKARDQAAAHLREAYRLAATLGARLHVERSQALARALDLVLDPA